MFSFLSSRTIPWIREPFIPTQAPTGRYGHRTTQRPLLLSLPEYGQSLDGDQTIVDFRNFKFEQTLQEQFVCTGKDDLRIVVIVIHRCTIARTVSPYGKNQSGSVLFSGAATHYPRHPTTGSPSSIPGKHRLR